MFSVPSRGASVPVSFFLQGSAQLSLLDLCMPRQGHGERVLLQALFVPGLLDPSNSRAGICFAMLYSAYLIGACGHLIIKPKMKCVRR